MCNAETLKREMIDIHMHVIPGVDDGAEDMMMARSLLSAAKDQNIYKIFATPHNSAFDHSTEETNTHFQNLIDQAAQFFPEVKLYPGCEVKCDMDHMDEILENIKSGKYPTLNGTNYVLIEFSRWVRPERTVPCVEAVINAGYVPIIAHMELYEYLNKHMELVEQFRKLGALIQVNVPSLFDEMDEYVKSWARQLVVEHKVDFLGTDAHRRFDRPPSSQMGLNWLYENVDQEYADAIAWKNALRMLLNK